MKLLFFGVLQDIAGKTTFDWSQVKDTDQLKSELLAHHPELADRSFMIAVNKKISAGNISLRENDEVALLPPFSGG